MAATSTPVATPLTTGPLIIRFDGSVLDATHHENPSAAIGYVIEDAMKPDTAVEVSRSLDYWVSNTHVEFDAMLAALDHLLDLGFTGHVNICGDCESVMNLVDPKCQSTPNDRLMQYYVERAQNRIAEFDSYTLNYVRRDNNKTADKLAEDGHFAASL